MVSGEAAEYGGVIVRKCERNSKSEQRTLKLAQIEAQEFVAQIEAQEFVEQENNGKVKPHEQIHYNYISEKENRKRRWRVNTGS